MKNVLKWSLAIAVSFFFHAGVAKVLEDQPEKIQIEGGALMQMATLGEAFSDTISSGNLNDTLEPMEEPIEKVEPTQEDFFVQTTTVDELLEPMQKIATLSVPVKNPDTAELSSDSIEDSQTTDVLEPTLPKPQTVPVPKKREVLEPTPQLRKKTEVQKRKPVAEKPKPKKPTRKAASGDGGKSQATRKSGTNTGKRKADGKTDGKNNRLASLVGNAAVSNYPGKIVRKLRRSLRYPSEAKRKNVRGQVLVSFTVSKNGGVSAIRLVQGSGSKILDQAALQTVRRAAPFPRIPEAAGRSRWAFKVPLAFQ